MNIALKWPRILTAVAAVFLIGALFLPIWKIDLTAPQYPEGLGLIIKANGIGGNVDIINGLNHYIGMKTLHSEDFIEFTLLPYIIGFLVITGLIAVFINRKKIYYTYIALFMFVAILSMVDFYRWEYNYGHDLNPDAAIQVPGMAYQPPLIGYKQLLNFGAFSIPDKGGWLFIAAGLLLFIAYILLLQPKWISFTKHARPALAVFILIFMQSCSAGPQPVKYGSDACEFCKMTIMDKKFACELVTDKGKVYFFDDVHCLLKYKKDKGAKGTIYINDYNGTDEMNKAETMFYVKSNEVKSPMGGMVAAFKNEAAKNDLQQKVAGVSLSLTEVEKELSK